MRTTSRCTRSRWYRLIARADKVNREKIRSAFPGAELAIASGVLKAAAT